MGMPHASELEPDPSMVKLALTGLAATSVEWYDFFLYGTGAALVFPTVFFPKTLPASVALMASFSTFAVGFFARPIGAVIFGHLGDGAGRKTALVAALCLMGVATTLIGCLPSYATAGIFAPILLITLRFVQGLAIGGQWGGAMLLLTESAPSGRRGFYGSFAQAGVPVGVILANLAFLVVGAATTTDAFLAWGWRIPFAFSIALVALGLFVQLRLEDTAAFRSLRQTEIAKPNARGHVTTQRIRASAPARRSPTRAQRSPVLEALHMYPREIILAAGSFVASNIVFYIFITFIIAYGTNPAGLNVPRTTMLSAVLVATAVTMPTVVIFGALSDRYGRRVIFMAGTVLMSVWGFALFPLIETRSFAWIVLGVGVGQLLNQMMYGPLAALFAELFKTGVRYSGASLGYQIGSIFGGALAPIIATGVLAKFHGSFGISVYIAIACAVSLGSVALLKETCRTDLRELGDTQT